MFFFNVHKSGGGGGGGGLIKRLSAHGLKNIWMMKTKANGNYSWTKNWNVSEGKGFSPAT